MFAYMLGEWKEWKSRGLRRSVPIAVFAIVLVGAITLLQPLFMAIALTLLSLGGGWSAGNRLQATGSARAYVLGCGIPPRTLVAGKVLAYAGIYLVHGFILSPALVLMAVLWGLPLSAIAVCLLCWMTAFAVALASGLASSLAYANSDPLFGFGMMAIWLIPGFLLPRLAMSNPLLQAWAALREGEAARPLLGAAAQALLLLILMAAASSLIVSARRRANA